MRILAIRGANIASLTEFDIDFQVEPLRSAGIFAITGPTGAGKSSLLDAMCLALYQRAPRLDDLSGRETKMESRFGAIGQADIRNLLRRGCDTGHAECDFLGGDGARYRARWGYRAARKKGAAVQEEMSLVRLDDMQVLEGSSSRKGDFQSRILSLLGLSYGQFMRTAMLAQGRFAEFLRSNEDERADLLEKLTGTEVHGRISKRIFDRTREAREQAAALERELQGLELLDEPARTELATEKAALEVAIPGLERRGQDLRRFLEGLDRLAEIRGNRGRIDLELEEARTRQRAIGQAFEASRAQLERAEAERERNAPDIRRARGLDAELALAQEARDRRQETLDGTRDALEELARHQRTLVDSLEALRRGIGTDREWIEARRAKLEPLAGNWPLWEERLRRAERLRIEAADGRAAAERSGAMLLEAQARLAAVSSELAEFGIPEAEDATSIHEELEHRSARRQALQTLVPWLELRGQIEARERMQAQRSEQASRLETARPALEAAWSTAHRILEDTRSALAGDVEHLRAGLREGSPCPVCGGMEHPWASALPALDALLARHAREEEASREAHEACRAELAGLRPLMEEDRQVLADLRDRFLRTDPDPGLSAELGTSPDPQRWLAEEMSLSLSRERDGLARLKEIQKRDEARSKLAEAEGGRERAREAVERDSDRLRSLVSDLGGCLAALDAPFGSAAWRTRWEANPAFVEQVTGSVHEFLERRGNLDGNERKAEPLSATVETHRLSVEAKERESASAARALEEAGRELAQAARRRGDLLEGRPVAEVEAALEQALREARECVDKAASRQAQAVAGISTLEGRTIEAVEREDSELRELAAMETSLFGSEDLRGDDPARRVRGEEEARRTESDLTSRRGRLAESSLRLSRDRENLERAGDLARRIARSRQGAEEWSLLCEQVGSADGKLFKRIAQQFTLEILLEEANAQLVSVAPRYSLRMLDGSLHFAVLDHESYDELRPVQTLSGGESFLVSLGLALGLSRMAGGEVSVESLFIDEGFGTLDAETLQGVMKALSSLHAQGRKVGVITHVEEMKDQIPVQIQVVPTGPGRSVVRIAG
jgi:exonuclease SbcC